MKPTTELQTLFDNQLKPALQSLERKRKSLMCKYIGFWFGVTASVACIWILTKYSDLFFYGGIIGILLFGILLLLTNNESFMTYCKHIDNNQSMFSLIVNGKCF